jgi:tetratricopeptide (TPR) repeat protein
MPCPSTPSLPELPTPLSRTGVRRVLWVLTATLVVSPLLHAGPTQAAETENVRKAREHYKAGDEAFKAGRYQDAYREWEAGYNLSPRPLFLLNMAHAERRRGELHNARSLYRRYLLMEPDSKLRGEVESVLKEIDRVLEEEEAKKTSQTAPPPASEAPPSAGEAVQPRSLSAPPESVAASPPFLESQIEASRPDQAGAPAIYKRWWFWGGLATVAAAGVGGWVLLRGEPYTRNGSLGTIGR